MKNLTPEEWIQEIDNALKYRQQFGMENAWNKLELDYTNHPTSDTSIGPNLVYSMGDSLLSSLTVPDPEFVLSAEHLAGVDRAPIVEAVDNWLIKKLKLKREVEAAILNSYLFSRSILKIGYDSEFGWSPYYDIGKGNNLMGMTLTQFNKKGQRIEMGNASPGMPWVKVVAPQDFVVPWGTSFIDNAAWAAHRIIRLNDHIKDDPKYVNTSRLQPNMSMESYINSYGNVAARYRRSHNSTTSAHTESIKSIFNVLWEIHDKRTGRIFVVTRDHDKFLRNSVDALQVAGLPFVSTTLVNHPRSFWGTPQAYYLGQIQNTQYDISLQQEKQRRINCLKFLANKNIISEDAMNKLMSGDVGALAMVETTMNLKDAVVPFPAGSLIDFVMQSNANRSDARDAIGFSRNQLGEFDSKTHRSAREASFVREGSQTRTSRRMNSVIELYIEAIKKVNKIIFTYWKVPRYMMIGNENVKFTGEELEGDYLYDITLSTKRNMSLAQRKIESLQVMAQLMQIPGIDMEALKQYVIDASSDPAFSNLLGNNKKQSSPGGQANAGI